MLLVFAHPDDESFTCGGTIAKYVKAGWDIDLLCASLGEAGQTGDLGNMTPSQLGQIRRKEVEKAGELLGISTITFMGYMDGTLKTEPPGGLEDDIYKKMEELVPDVVITFNTVGISNHPDHIRMCYATTFAFQKYAKWVHGQLSESPEYNEDLAPKLYYACIPESTIVYLKKKKVIPEESFGKPWTGTEDKLVITVINIGAYRSIKKKALMQHTSQRANVDRFYSLKNNPLGNFEYFILRMQGIREVFMGNNDRVSSKL